MNENVPIKALWNRRMLLDNFGTEEKVINWSLENGLLPKVRYCEGRKSNRHCKYEMHVNDNRGRAGSFRCGICRAEKSILCDSWFMNARMPLSKVISIMYSFAQQEKYADCILEAKESDCDTTLGEDTVAAWYRYCRQMVVDDFLVREVERGKIGGPGCTVQLDESKFGRRKFNRGRKVDGHWVLGIIANGSEDFRLIVCPDNLRNADTLIPIIKEHVAVGTEIHTDSWKAYSQLTQHGYIHKCVNHSDPENRFIAIDGTHTQRIEAQWKDWFRERRVPGFQFFETLVEYHWRREIKKNRLDPFDRLLFAVKRYYNKNM